MAHRTVYQVKERAQAHLGDATGGTFNPQSLHYAFEVAWEDLYEFLALHQLPAVELIVEKVLDALDTSFAITDEVINNFGSLRMLEAKPQGSAADQYAVLQPVAVLPDSSPGSLLTYYTIRGDTIYFVGSTQAQDLRITYIATGVAPNDDSALVTFSGIHKYLAWRTAGVAGAPEGYANAATCNAEAERVRNEIIDIGVRNLQRVPIQQPAYDIQPMCYGPILPWLITDGN